MECGRVEANGRAEEITGNMSCELKIQIFGNVMLCHWVSFPDVSRARVTFVIRGTLFVFASL